MGEFGGKGWGWGFTAVAAEQLAAGGGVGRVALLKHPPQQRLRVFPVGPALSYRPIVPQHRRPVQRPPAGAAAAGRARGRGGFEGGVVGVRDGVEVVGGDHAAAGDGRESAAVEDPAQRGRVGVARHACDGGAGAGDGGGGGKNEVNADWTEAWAGGGANGILELGVRPEDAEAAEEERDGVVAMRRGRGAVSELGGIGGTAFGAMTGAGTAGEARLERLILGGGKAGKWGVSVMTLRCRVQRLMLVVPAVFGFMLEEALTKVSEFAQVLEFLHVLGDADQAA
jgi:hypothetical protein